jgi:hypothetical protein
MEPIGEDDKYMLIPVERPYMNLFAHLEHYRENEKVITDYAEKYIKNTIYSAKKRKI